jgi:signal peptidase I
MEPTLFAGDRIVISKVDYRLHAPERGDVVVFRPPPPACPADASECVPFVKRVIAIAGDVVELRDGRVVVNGAPLVEPYAGAPTGPEGSAVTYPFTVPADSLFVLGDNRPVSGDSRAWGAVPRSSVAGKAYAAFWPPDHARWLLR